MAFRFWRRIKLAPGVRLNLSKSGGSLSFGPRGASYTVGPRGRRLTAGIPGSGLFYTVQLGGGSSRRRGRSGEAAPAEPQIPPADRLTLGFFQKLFTSSEEQRLVEGLRELVAGHERAALQILQEQAEHFADAAWLAGVLAYRHERDELAEKWLGVIADGPPEGLGEMLGKYGLRATTSVGITEELTVHVEPGLRGALLVLVELFQRQGRRELALGALQRLRTLTPQDPLLRVSLAELLLDGEGTPEREVLRRVDRLGRDVKNETALHAALLLYRGRALRLLGMPTAARELLTAAFRRKVDRPQELLLAIQYERALAYREEGKERRYREELERIYLEDDRFEDVAERLERHASE